MAQVNWSEKDEKYWVKDLKGENLFFESSLDAQAAARQVTLDTAVKAEVDAITKWLKAHGMRQIAMMIEEGRYK